MTTDDVLGRRGRADRRGGQLGERRSGDGNRSIAEIPVFLMILGAALVHATLLTGNARSSSAGNSRSRHLITEGVTPHPLYLIELSIDRRLVPRLAGCLPKGEHTNRACTV